MPKKQKPRDIVILCGFDKNDKQVVEKQMTWDQYYDGENPMIDSPEYLSSLKIVKVIGTLYTDDGKISQHFANRYCEQGNYKGGKATFDDGTVQEF